MKDLFVLFQTSFRDVNNVIVFVEQLAKNE